MRSSRDDAQRQQIGELFLSSVEEAVRLTASSAATMRDPWLESESIARQDDLERRLTHMELRVQCAETWNQSILTELRTETAARVVLEQRISSVEMLLAMQSSEVPDQTTLAEFREGGARQPLLEQRIESVEQAIESLTVCPWQMALADYHKKLEALREGMKALVEDSLLAVGEKFSDMDEAMGGLQMCVRAWGPPPRPDPGAAAAVAAPPEVRYRWSFSSGDPAGDVKVVVPIGELSAAQVIEVVVKRKNLHVGLAGMEPIIHDALWIEVNETETTWEIDTVEGKRSIIIELVKRNKYDMWQYLLLKERDIIVCAPCAMETMADVMTTIKVRLTKVEEKLKAVRATVRVLSPEH